MIAIIRYESTKSTWLDAIRNKFPGFETILSVFYQLRFLQFISFYEIVRPKFRSNKLMCLDEIYRTKFFILLRFQLAYFSVLSLY